MNLENEYARNLARAVSWDGRRTSGVEADMRKIQAITPAVIACLEEGLRAAKGQLTFACADIAAMDLFFKTFNGFLAENGDDIDWYLEEAFHRTFASENEKLFPPDLDGLTGQNDEYIPF